MLLKTVVSYQWSVKAWSFLENQPQTDH